MTDLAKYCEMCGYPNKAEFRFTDSESSYMDLCLKCHEEVELEASQGIHAPSWGSPAGDSGYTAYCNDRPLNGKFARHWERVTCKSCLAKRKESNQ